MTLHSGRPRPRGRIVVVMCLLATVLAPAAARVAADAQGAAPRTVRNDGVHVLVKFKQPTMRAEAFALHRRLGAVLSGRLGSLGIDVLEVRAGESVSSVAARYRASGAVEWAEPNVVYRASAVPNDPLFGGNGTSNDQWGLNNIGQQGGTAGADVRAVSGWDLAGGTSGSPWPTGSYAIGIVDTGVASNHEDLQGKVITPCFSALSGNGSLGSGCADDNDHGTHVAGIAASIANNGRGGAGVAFDARIYMCKALDFMGAGFSADIAGCIDELVSRRSEHNIRVINLSLGGAPSEAVRSAVDAAASSGILVLAAAGNAGAPVVEYPAGYSSVVGVGATTRTDTRASFSNFNSSVEVSAPGAQIASTLLGGGYGLMSGTSMATPLAAGVAAMISSRMALTGSSLRDALRNSADDLGEPGRDDSFGYGRVNLCRGLGGTSCGSSTPPSPGPSGSPGPTPVPADGQLGGTAYLFGGFLPAWLTNVSYGSGSVITGLFGDYSVTLAPGTYTLTASVLFLPCRAGSSSGPTTTTVTVEPNTTSTVDWYC